MVFSLFRRRRASSFELLLSSCCCSRNFICFCREASARRPSGGLQGLLEKHPGLCALRAAGSVYWLLMLSPPQQPRITESLSPPLLHPYLCFSQTQQGPSANRERSLTLKLLWILLSCYEDLWGGQHPVHSDNLFFKSKGVQSKQILLLHSAPYPAKPFALASQFSLLLAA